MDIMPLVNVKELSIVLFVDDGVCAIFDREGVIVRLQFSMWLLSTNGSPEVSNIPRRDSGIHEYLPPAVLSS